MRVRALLFLLVLSTALSCRSSRSVVLQPVLPPLDVDNNSVFDVNVFALPSASVTSRVRLGMVGAFSTMTLQLPRNAINAGGTLYLYLHAIGSNANWVAPAIVVSSDMRICLDIFADPSGDLSRSSVYTRLQDDSGGRTTCTRQRPASGER